MATNNLLKKLLESGVHFGHQTKRWNPKMKQYIFGERNGIHIINLEKTADAIEKAREFLSDVAAKGGKVLFVGTKKQARDIIAKKAEECDMYYMAERWLGGTLTNFATIRQSVSRLQRIEEIKESGKFEELRKKERAHLNKEEEKLRKNLCGIVKMEKLPDCLFIVDTKYEDIAVKEGVRLGIPIVAMLDTNADPDKIDYPIPANDDAFKAISFITGLLCESIVAGRTAYLSSTPKEEAAAPVQETEAAENTQAPEGETPAEAVEERASE